jgi:hypothetical protein
MRTLLCCLALAFSFNLHAQNPYLSFNKEDSTKQLVILENSRWVATANLSIDSTITVFDTTYTIENSVRALLLALQTATVGDRVISEQNKLLKMLIANSQDTAAVNASILRVNELIAEYKAPYNYDTSYLHAPERIDSIVNITGFLVTGQNVVVTPHYEDGTKTTYKAPLNDRIIGVWIPNLKTVGNLRATIDYYTAPSQVIYPIKPN